MSSSWTIAPERFAALGIMLGFGVRELWLLRYGRLRLQSWPRQTNVWGWVKDLGLQSSLWIDSLMKGSSVSFNKIIYQVAAGHCFDFRGSARRDSGDEKILVPMSQVLHWPRGTT